MLGLVTSMVLRCDECIKYHLGKSHELGVATEEMYKVFGITNLLTAQELYQIPGGQLNTGKN